MAVYRKFANYLAIENKPLMHKNSKKSAKMNTTFDKDYSVDKYDSNVIIPQKPIEVPMYISVVEFKEIIEEVITNYGLLEECIVRLMFQCGLRIGECLGLTADDIVMEKIEDKYATVAYLRNRLSDKSAMVKLFCITLT